MQIRVPQFRNSITAKLGKLSTGSLNKFRMLHSCNVCSAVIGGNLSITMNRHSWLINRNWLYDDGAVDATRIFWSMRQRGLGPPASLLEPAHLNIAYPVSISEGFEPTFKGRGLLVFGMRSRVGRARQHHRAAAFAGAVTEFLAECPAEIGR